MGSAFYAHPSVRRARHATRQRRPYSEDVPEVLMKATAVHIERIVQMHPTWTPEKIVQEALHSTEASHSSHPYWQACAQSPYATYLFGRFHNDLVEDLTTLLSTDLGLHCSDAAP